MKKLYICEKPSVARELAAHMGISGSEIPGAISGNDVVVTWVYGHLLAEFDPEDYDPTLKNWSLDSLPILPDKWMVKVRDQPYVKKQFKVIEKLLAQVPTVVIATDYDREGEVIGRSLLEKCQFKGTVRRILITAQDSRSLTEALENEFDASKSLPAYFAGLGRTRSDWMLGMNMSRFYTISAKEKGFDGVWSVGRVQTPTLNMVVERDLEIENFRSKDFYDITVGYEVFGQAYIAKVSVPDDATDDSRRLLNIDLAQSICRELRQHKELQVIKVIRKPETENPPLPLNMSVAQQQASKQWGWAAKKTLEVAQSLYEKHKLTSYPRTDCQYLKESMFDNVEETVAGILANDEGCKALIESIDLKIKSKAWNDKKITAHHAIIPTRSKSGMSALSEDEKSLYGLIREFYLYQFAPASQTEATNIEFAAGNYRLMTKGSVVIEAGWRGIFNKHSEQKSLLIPAIKEGEAFKIQSVEILTKKTTPPEHYTDGTLIAGMINAAKLEQDPELKKRLKESSGIGTEATRANILDILRHRGLVEDKGKKIISTSKGRALIGVVDVRLKSLGSTALMEQALDDISNGNGRLDEYLEEVRKLVTDLCASSQGITLQAEVHSCTSCNKPLRRITKRGKDSYDFWGCTGFPACKKSYKNKGNKPDLTQG